VRVNGGVQSARGSVIRGIGPLRGEWPDYGVSCCDGGKNRSDDGTDEKTVVLFEYENRGRNGSGFIGGPVPERGALL